MRSVLELEQLATMDPVRRNEIFCRAEQWQALLTGSYTIIAQWTASVNDALAAKCTLFDCSTLIILFSLATSETHPKAHSAGTNQ
jgi:hypothetical protein